MEAEISWESKGGGNNSGSIHISWRGLFNTQNKDNLRSKWARIFALKDLKYN